MIQVLVMILLAVAGLTAPICFGLEILYGWNSAKVFWVVQFSLISVITLALISIVWKIMGKNNLNL